jgi:hypothetical protein
MLKRAIVPILFTLFFSQGLAAQAPAEEGPQLKLIFFQTLSCHECQAVKEEILPRIKEKFRQKIDIEYRDIADIKNYEFLLSLKKQYGLTQDLKVPIVLAGEKFLSGREKIGRELDKTIEEALSSSGPKEARGFKVDLTKYFLSFTPLAVIFSGLIDGINPCAFTVIVFFISFLSLQGYRKRELFIIGAVFIAAVFLTYLLLGLGLFGFFYSLKVFWLLRRLINLGIGIFSLFLGCLAVYDFLKYKKTGKAEDMTLQLPESLKKRIHSLIGLHYRKSSSGDPAALKRSILRLILAAFVTGFLISLLEAVCTGQTYLPTITFILKTTPIKLRAIGFLILYNFMFVVPLFLILAFALMGVSSEQFGRVLKQHFLTVKALMAGLFFGLGIFLIWKG